MQKTKCKLVGQDGNVFNVIGLVTKALKRDGRVDEANEFKSRAISSSSYEEVIQLATEYVEEF